MDTPAAYARFRQSHIVLRETSYIMRITTQTSGSIRYEMTTMDYRVRRALCKMTSKQFES